MLLSPNLTAILTSRARRATRGGAPATKRRRRSSRALSAAVLTGLLLVALARPARAEEGRTSSLSWVELPGATGCGGAPTVARAVEARLGRHAIVSPVDAELSIEAYVEHSTRPPLWHAVVQLRGRDGAVLGYRELASTADDCDELRASVALVAALMIDPDAAARAPAPSAPAPPAPSVTPPPPPAPSCPLSPESSLPPRVIIKRVEVPAPPPPPSPWTVKPAAAVALGAGLLPSTSVGAHVGVAVGMPRLWAFEVFGRAWGSQTVGAQQGAQVRFTLIDLGARACPLTLGTRDRSSFTLCAGLELGLMQADSQGFASQRRSVDPTLRFAVPAKLSMAMGHGLSMEFGGQLGVGIYRSRFDYDDPTRATRVVSTESLFTGEAHLGLGVDLR